MSLYPQAIDSDSEIPMINDNLSEAGGLVINALRDAIFAMQTEIGIIPAGSAGTLADRLDVSLNADGTIKSSALSSVGLVTLPITNSQVGSNAGIEESKLSLTHSTSDLHTLTTANSVLINSVNSFLNELSSDFTLHLSGSTYLSDGSTSAKHVLSQIDLNIVPTDSRDTSYTWLGLFDKTGTQRVATNAAAALLEINDDLIDHENAITDAHVATAISVDTDNFNEIPITANTIQKALDYLDDSEVINMGQHRATQHANAISRIARIESLFLGDGYADVIVSPTSVTTYLVHNPNVTPVDDLSIGDDIVKFVPSNSNFTFDAQFSKVRPGDVIRINYANGVEAQFIIDSIRYIPGTEWIVRINGTNLYDTTNALAMITKPLYDDNTYGVLAVAPVNARNSSGQIYTNILTSVIIGHPRAASALGLGFDAGQLNNHHYNLYLEFYPTGNPTEKTISLPAIDVTGNEGITPGKYTLQSVVHNTNNKLREIGYNLRLLAFEYNGEFGLMAADVIDNASFAIITGDNSSGTLVTGTYLNNVIGGDTLDTFDALGFGSTGSNIASPAFQSSWTDETAAQLPTKIITPAKYRYAIVNGQKIDTFADTYLATDGYWDGYISARNVIGITNVETTYTILSDLKAAGLRAGKTITIQPTIEYNDPDYFDVDYGRFIIKNVNFTEPCGASGPSTEITVINGLHASGSGFGFSSSPSLPVKIYFSYDSVGFDSQNVIDSSISSDDFRRHHEIFINDEGKTFSHERARLPRQSETTSLLNSSNWHILSVSEKLRGYQDSDPLVFNKNIRLYILSYDSTSGEFDGYLGQRIESTINITKTGPISTGRKNIPVKFYDETGIDYVEMIFDDQNPYPGNNVISTAIPRYIDIELFPSLIPNDELFLLATCEVNWDPESGQDIVQYVINRRDFGSVDEDDFTDSAINFISQADKYIHQNGVVSGLTYDQTGSNGEVFYKGGIAFVNGKIVLTNNGSVTIPQIYPQGTALPQTVNWIVCVNEFGNFVPVLLTTSKQQYFGTVGASNYYLQSVTFEELTNKRKDLTPISLIVATIASITISSVTDMRKIIVDNDSTIPIVWNSEDVSGNFNSIESVVNWITYSNKSKNFVNVRGTFNIDTEIDLSGFTNLVIFDGTESTFNISSDNGILLGDNLTLRNFTFNYSGTGTPASANSLINIGNGCLYSDTAIDNLTIENCVFTNTTDNQRPPFILMQVPSGDTLRNINIKNNTFNDSAASTDLTKSQAAIVIITANDDSDPALIIDSNIENNKCKQYQGIYVTTIAGGAGAEAPGLNALNVNILNNNCGIIGILTAATSNALSIKRSFGISVDNNTCKIIGSLFGDGRTFPDSGELAYGIGNITVINNKSNWILFHNRQISASNQYSTLQINNNILTGFDDGFLGLFTPTVPNYAIYVFEVSNTDSAETLIEGNKIQFGYYSGTWGYDRGISCGCSATITNNIIRGLNASATGIHVSNDEGGTSVKRYIVTNNKIYRGTANITNYIAVPGSSSSTHEGFVCDNYFDSATIDGSAVTVINNIPDNWVITRNKNQTFVALIAVSSGNWSINGIAVGTDTIATSDSTITFDVSTPNANKVTLAYNDGSVHNNFRWNLSLLDILPENVKVTGLSFIYNSGIASPSTGAITIGSKFTTNTETNSTATISSTGDNTVTVTMAGAGMVRYGNAASEVTPFVYINFDLNNASPFNVVVSNLKITYRY